MPMSDWDRLSNNISDYLEGKLDSSTKKEFEEEIDKNPNLKNLTGRMAGLSKLLGNLPERKCSEEFSAQLRDRIHRETSNVKAFTIPVKKYSYAFSLVVLAVISVFTFNVLTEEGDSIDALPESSNIQSVQPEPVYQNNMQPATTVKADNKQVDIKTIDENSAAADSLVNKPIKEKNPNIKYVDEKINK
jgi:anti-sigma factor RsiW